MSSFGDAAVPVSSAPTAAEEPMPTPALPLSSPIHGSGGGVVSRGLSPSSGNRVNQSFCDRSLPRKVSCSTHVTSLAQATGDAPAVMTGVAVSQSMKKPAPSAAAPATASSSAASSVKENVMAPVRATPLLSPRTRTHTAIASPTSAAQTAAVDASRGCSKAAVDAVEVTDSPPVVALTATRRALNNTNTNTSGKSDQKASTVTDNTPPFVKPQWTPPASPTSATAPTLPAATTATPSEAPLLSPRRRVAAVVAECKAAIDDAALSSPASPPPPLPSSVSCKTGASVLTEESKKEMTPVEAGAPPSHKAAKGESKPPSPPPQAAEEQSPAAAPFKTAISLESAPQRSPRVANALTPRQRSTTSTTTTGAAGTVHPSKKDESTTTTTPTTTNGNGAADAVDGETKSPSKESSPAPTDVAAAASAAVLATPRGASMASRVEEIRARLASSRLPSTSTTTTAASSFHITPRSSVGSAVPVRLAIAAHTTAKDTCDDAAGATSNTAADTVKELQHTVKEKEKTITQLTREHAKTTQQLEKASAKAAEMQRKWEAEKVAHAADKKEAITQRLEAQKEVRQAQSTARGAQVAHEKLQKEVEKLKEKLAVAGTAAASQTTSTATTPMATPRGAPLKVSASPNVDASEVAGLRGKLTRLERDNAALLESAAALKGKSEGAVEAAVLAAKAEAAVALQSAQAEVERLGEELRRLTGTVAKRDAALEAKEVEIDQLREQKQQHRIINEADRFKQARTGATTNTTELVAATAAATPSSSEPRPEPEAPPATPQQPQQQQQQQQQPLSPPRIPRQVVTFSLSAKEVTSQLQEELTASQWQLGTYKRLQEQADRRIEQLEAELAVMQQRARDAVEALQRRAQEGREHKMNSTSSTSDATALEATRKELAKVRADCSALKQQVRGQGQEAVTLQSALEEAEDERDVYERQLRDLQQQHRRVEGAAETMKAEMAARVATLEEKLRHMTQELATAHDASKGIEVKWEEAVAEREALQRRCAELEKQAASAATEAAQPTAAVSLNRQIEHYKKKSKLLTTKLSVAERELQVLGEDYTRVCGERDAAVMRYRTEEASRPALSPQETAMQQQQQQNREGVLLAETSFHSGGVAVHDDVSRDLTDALLSAKRAASARKLLRGDEGAFTNALAQEQEARVQLAREVTALQSKVAAMSQLASPVMHSLISDSVESIPSVCHEEVAATQRACTSDAPARARSPQTTHALDLRFFDPTTGSDAALSTAASTTGRTARWGHHEHLNGLSAPSCSVSPSLAAAASVVSPGRSQARPTASLSPRRFVVRGGHDGGGSGPSGTASAYTVEREAALDALYSEEPLPPLYTPLSEEPTVTNTATAGGGATAAAGRSFDLLFSSTAGRLLVSKRGRRLHRPHLTARSLPRSSTDGAGEGEGDAKASCCCAALASLSHTLYSARMVAEGLYHLKHTYRFVLRVLTDCEAGDILVGFADRHVPLESFGYRGNALRYRGCYYVGLQGGRLYAPSQGVCGEVYVGWAAAAGEAAARRWRHREGVARYSCTAEAEGGPFHPISSSPPSSASLSPSGRRGGAVPAECVVRAGDEVACSLRLDDQSMRVEWNGVDCGVAFTGVSLNASLYPCVEVNCGGGTVELL